MSVRGLYDKPLIQALDGLGIELDQRMYAALDMQTDEKLRDDMLFIALYKLNAICTRYLHFEKSELLQVYESVFGEQPSSTVAADQIRVTSAILEDILSRAIRTADRSSTLGTKDFLRALFAHAQDFAHSYQGQPFTVHLLWKLYGHEPTSPIRLIDTPEVKSLVSTLQASVDGTEDFQYIMTLNEDQIIFSVTSILGDYVQQNDSGLLFPRRAVLMHFKECFGLFSVDEIEELEKLINSSTVKELDLQRFFEQYPHFLRRWDHREVYSQVVLARDEGALRPDFILTDRELQRAAILELKLPKPKLVRRQHNRDRFASAVMEARSQLLEYRDWFREQQNRTRLQPIVGMEILEPHLAVVIGRASEFRDEIDRQKLQSRNPEVEVVTYDDILTYARRRRTIMNPGTDQTLM